MEEKKEALVEKFSEISELVNSEFEIEESYIAYDIPTFILKEGKTKEPFERLSMKMKERNLIPFLRKVGGKPVLRILEAPKPKPIKVLIPLSLFLATLGSVFVTGIYPHGLSFIETVGYMLRPIPNLFILSVLFTISIFAIFGLHEFGHKIAAKKHDIECGPPYFIPCPPLPYIIPIGTLGAVITQKEFPINRDQLFDIGFLGPFMGFLVLIAITVIGIELSPFIPFLPGLQRLPAPLLFHIFLRLKPIPQGFVLYCHPVLFAAWVGAFATSLNLLPSWQLDGGHIARALFGKTGHKIVSFLSVVFLLLIGQIFLALFLATFLFIFRGEHPGSLDDISTLSRSRKALALAYLLILVLCLPIF